MNSSDRSTPGSTSRRSVLSMLAAGATGLALTACDRDPEQKAGSDTSGAPKPGAPSSPTLKNFGVSSGHPKATEAGMSILRRRGNAIDAAIATAFADAVMQPASSGIGGGGVTIVVRGDERKNHDYREVVANNGKIPASGAGTPGFVAGMSYLHDTYGSMKWAALLEPAIGLADDGAEVSRYLADTLARPLGNRVTRTLRHFRRDDGTPLREGDVLIQKDLADAMRLLADGGSDAFYRGPLTDSLIKVPGIDDESLVSYQIQHSTPAGGRLGKYEFLSGAPALPGAAIVQLTQIAQALGIAEVAPNSAEFIDIQSRAWQVADRSVQRWFGDPDFVDVPVDALTDPEKNTAIAKALPRKPLARTSGSYSGAPNTTHISVVDRDGMAVSMTNTITNYWGSGQYVRGFFMNDQLKRFRDIGTGSANRPEPGRRSVTWSSPSMVLDGEGRPVLPIGAPGGRQIPNTTASVVMRWALLGQTLEQAVPAPRFILDNGLLKLESGALQQDLNRMGYRTRVVPAADRANWGSVQALAIDWSSGTVSGVADTRRSAGYAIGS